MASKHDNFMDKLNCVCSIDSEQFVECWKHYDMDGNGFIEGEEMDKLFSDLIHMAVKGRKLSAGSIEKLQKTFMEEYDIDKDGKIGISEMAQLLPTEENFLVLFKAEHMLSSGKDFMLIWKKYSKKHGFIGTKVLRDFLKELFEKSGRKVPADKICEYASSIVKLYDKNNDGILSFKELSGLLPIEENFLLQFKGSHQIDVATFNKIFEHYDKDKNGTISGSELDTFLMDILTGLRPDDEASNQDLQKFKKMVMKSCDLTKDGQLQKEEMALWLGIPISIY